MSTDKSTYQLEVTKTMAVCPIGETAGRQYIGEGSIPVLSCEGACIRGEIARLAANLVAKETGFRRACHGELFTAPHSEIAKWVTGARKVVVVDGCFMGCHGRVLENLIGQEALVRVDALAIYRKYTDLIDIDSVPEHERKETARQVADTVLEVLGLRKGAGDGAPCGCQPDAARDAVAAPKTCG